MIMKKGLLILVVLLLIFVSGCVSGGLRPVAPASQAPVGGTNGIQIKSFTVSPERVKVGGEVQIEMIAENFGQHKATQVKAVLGKFAGGILNQENIPLVDSGETELDPAIITGGRTLPGEEGVWFWEGTINQQFLGSSPGELNHWVTASLFYRYKTSAIGTIRLLGTNEFNRRVHSRKVIPTGGTQQGGQGPVTVEVLVRDEILDPNKNNDIDIAIVISNRGQGIITSDITASGAFEDNKVRIESFNVYGLDSGDCLRQELIRLGPQQSRTIRCEIQVSGNVELEDKAFEITVEYPYRLDVAAPITIIGKEPL